MAGAGAALPRGARWKEREDDLKCLCMYASKSEISYFPNEEFKKYQFPRRSSPGILVFLLAPLTSLAPEAVKGIQNTNFTQHMNHSNVFWVDLVSLEATADLI